MDVVKIRGWGWLVLGALTLALSACGGGGPGGKGQLPDAPVRESAGPPTATPEGVDVPDEVTDAQLEVFRFVWGQINQAYAYADHNGADWRAIRDIYGTQVENGLTDEMFHEAMQAMVSELGDPATVYLTPSDIEEQLAAQEVAAAGPEEGYVGTLVGMPDGTREALTILYVFPDSPAERAGVQPHDVIVGIEGEPVPGEPDADTLERIRGEVGTDIMLTVQAPGDSPRALVVGRAPLNQASELEVEMVDRNIGYIFIPPGSDEASLGVRVTNELRSLREEENIEALIVDLRIARVGTQTEWPVDELLGLFVHGEAYQLYNASDEATISVTGRDVAGSQELPLVVLIGYDTVGLSEVFAGTLQSLDRATLVGGQTEGEVEIVYTVPIGENAALILAGFSTRSLDDEHWGRSGVRPDIEMDLRWEEFGADNDPQLEAAIREAEALIR